MRFSQTVVAEKWKQTIQISGPVDGVGLLGAMAEMSGESWALTSIGRWQWRKEFVSTNPDETVRIDMLKMMVMLVKLGLTFKGTMVQRYDDGRRNV